MSECCGAQKHVVIRKVIAVQLVTTALGWLSAAPMCAECLALMLCTTLHEIHVILCSKRAAGIASCPSTGSNGSHQHHSSDCHTFVCHLWLQVLIEDAEFIMNRAAAGEVSWDDIRPQLAEKYQQAGLSDVAEFANAVR